MSKSPLLPQLSYFRGRGLADQVRWMLAATNPSPSLPPFLFHPVDTNEEFRVLGKGEGDKEGGALLLFGQLPLLQIDGLNLVQSQAMVRYLARRGGLEGHTEGDRVRGECQSSFLLHMYFRYCTNHH